MVQPDAAADDESNDKNDGEADNNTETSAENIPTENNINNESNLQQDAIQSSPEPSNSEERVLSELTCDSSESVVPRHNSSHSNVDTTSSSNEEQVTTSDDTPRTRFDGNEAISQSVQDYISLLHQGDNFDTALSNHQSSSSAAATATVSIHNNCETKAAAAAAAAVVKQRIRDVPGLDDGHTIHLVPRPAPSDTSNANTNSNTTLSNNETDNSNNNDTTTSLFSNLEQSNMTSLSGSEGMNLLTAILGMGEMEGASSSTTVGPATFFEAMGLGGGATPTYNTTTTNVSRENRIPNPSSNMRRGRSSARARAAAARLTEADIRARDPGSVEPVRQGLMTLHTLLGDGVLSSSAGNENHGGENAMDDAMEEGKMDEGEEKMGSMIEGEDTPLSLRFSPTRPIISDSHNANPLSTNRQWYRGQWLDALDTVNQWLEATVVDIVLPSEILNTQNNTSTPIPQGPGTTNPHASIQPKRRSRRTPEAVVSANDFEGRRRLLLEPHHPHDTDNRIFTTPEEMRSTIIEAGYRERTDNTGVQLLLIHYNGWPHRWDEWIRSDSERIRPFRTRTRHRNTGVLASPTPSNVFAAAPATHIAEEDDEGERVSLLGEIHRVVSSVNEILGGVVTTTLENEAEMEDTTAFAPSNETSHLPWRFANPSGMENTLLQSLNYGSEEEEDAVPRSSRVDPLSRLDANQLRRLAPLMDRLGRTLTDAAPHIACLADSLPSPRAEVRSTVRSRESPSLSLLRDEMTLRERDREMNAWSSNIGNDADMDDSSINQEEALNDPDLSDFVNGMVNTSRSANRNDRDRDPLATGLLSNYISSQSGLDGGSNNDDNALTRLIRTGGGTLGGGRNGDGGIDIHIHAVVTGPGMNGTTGTTTPLPSILRNGNSSTSNNRSLDNITRSSQPTPSEEDQSLFSELYSASPTPLNMHGTTNSSVSMDDDGVALGLAETFEDCRSIEDESCSGDEIIEVTPSEVDVLTANVGDLDADTIPVDESDAEPKSTAQIASQSNNETPRENHIETPEQVDVDTSARHDSNGSIHTISEIGSMDSTSSPPPSSSRMETASPSFTNRLYSRTFGRLSRGNSRRPGNPS